MISTTEFFNLDEVQKQINIQKKNPHGSNEHRNAHIAILKAANTHGVARHFECLKTYDGK